MAMTSTTQSSYPSAARDGDKHESAPASVMSCIEAIEKITKTVLLAGFFGTWVVLLFQNREPAGQALHDLFELAPEIKQFNAGPVAVTFNESTVSSAIKVELDENNPHANDTIYIGKLTRVIQSLERDHYKRLLYVDTLRDLCKYEDSPVDVDYKFSLDQELQDRGLVRLTKSPALLNEVTVKRGSEQSDTIGLPQFCYTMNYTELGYDAKTTIVNTMTKSIKIAQH
jgi:hypothetical protein